MPYNGSGVFSILNTFVPNTTILSSAVNANYSDIATGLSDVLTRDGQAGMTAAFKAISGALSTPSITFTADATSGLYLSAAGIIGLVSNSLGMLLNTTVFCVLSAAIQAGGSNYAIGDTITETGGTAIIQPVLTVASVSGGAVSSVTVTVPGFYTTKPSNPVSQGSTSGVGTGCTLNLTYNDPTASAYRAVFTDQAGALLWQKFGASSFVSGLMAKANGFDFATAIGSANIAAVLGGTFQIAPQGRLTLSSGVPVMTSDVTAATSIFYTPYLGNVVPITTNATTFAARSFNQLTLALTSSHLTNTLYDIYVFDNAGTVTVGTGPAWTNSGAGTSSRGSGAGTTELGRLNGLLTNNNSMTARNGSTTYTVPANCGTYVGTFLTTSAGTTAMVFNPAATGGGTNNLLGLWNTFNRVAIQAASRESTSNWTYTSATLRPLDNSTSNRISYVDGFGECYISGAMACRISTATTNGSIARVGMGRNKTTGTYDFDSTVVAPSANGQNVVANPTGIWTPSLGLNYIQAMESGDGANTSIFIGGGTECYLLTSLMM